MIRYVYNYHPHKEIRIPLIGRTILNTLIQDSVHKPITLPDLILKKLQQVKFNNCSIWVKFDEYNEYISNIDNI